MEVHFTPGAQRALAEAAAWSSGIEPAELEAPALLLGLLAESECRAAILLAGCAIDGDMIRQRWPRLARREPSLGGEIASIVDLDRPEEIRRRLPRFSDELLIGMATVRRRFHNYPPPLMLATEHLLLGLVASGREVAVWLRARGLDADVLEGEIHRRSGYRSEPVLSDDPPQEEGTPSKEVGSAQYAAGSMQDAVGDRQESAGESQKPYREAAELAPRSSGSDLAPRPSDRIATLRVVDAAANRALEGLRVAEDYVRFVLDDQHLTGQLKGLRHALVAALAGVPIAARLAARETRADVGTSLTASSEQARLGPAAVLTANFTRVEEALRSLEEFGKLLDAGMAAQMKQLRYQTYTLHQAVETTRTSLDRLQYARLYVLIDGGPSPEAFALQVRALIEAGVHVIQLRDKRLEDRRLLARARLLGELVAGTDVLFIMNDRPDLAFLAGADGVHVGQAELTVKQARTIVGPDALVGVSTHSMAQAREAVLDGANYLGVGPTFPSNTKHFDEFPGLELLRTVAGEIRLPAFAIGGISEDNLPDVLGTGVQRVAVSGAIVAAPDPGAAARRLLAALK